MITRLPLPSSLSQFEEAVHWRSCRCGDGEALVNGFQDKTAVEAPGECAEVARQMFGVDHTMRGQQLFLMFASIVFAQRKAGWRAAALSEPVIHDAAGWRVASLTR